MLGAPNFIFQTDETSKLKKIVENKDVEKDGDSNNLKNNEVLYNILTKRFLFWREEKNCFDVCSFTLREFNMKRAKLYSVYSGIFIIWASLYLKLIT